MIIYVDVDCVLNDLIFKMIDRYRYDTGKEINIEDITTYDFGGCMSIEDAQAFNAMFSKKDLWDSLRPIPGSQDGLKKLLQKGHDIYLATATDPINFEWKCKWLNKYFPFIDQDNIICIKHKMLLSGDIIIDDCYDQLKHSMCHRVVFDYPWNRSDDLDYIYDVSRVRNWNDIVGIVDKIERSDKEWNMEM